MTPELLNKLKHLANIAAHLPHDVTLEDEDAAMKALHSELAADTVLQMIALAERTTAQDEVLTKIPRFNIDVDAGGDDIQEVPYPTGDFCRFEDVQALLAAAAPAPIQQEAPARQTLHTMEYEDGRIGWYFDCDGHYIDVEKDGSGKYSVYFRDRATGKEGWLDQADSATPPALAGSQVQAAGDVPWRVAEFWSSANPGKKCLMLAKDEQELSEWGKRSDFIRWCSPDPKAMREQP